MARPLSINHGAIVEYDRAIERYREASGDALADRFAEAVEAIITNLQKNPDRWPLYVGPVRRRVMAKWPFSIFYIAGHSVRILAIAHQNRQPDYWLGRR